MLAVTSSIKNNIIITIENQDQKMNKIKKVMMTIASCNNEKTIDEHDHKIIKIKRMMVTIVG